MKKITLLTALSLGALLSNASAAIIYNESSSPDLSGLFGSPTSLSFGLGANTVIGDIGNNGNTGAVNGAGTSVDRDADFFTFTVPFGVILSSINIDSHVPVPSGGGSFFGYTSGTSFSGQAFGDVDGFAIFNSTSGEVIDDFGSASGLSAGDYSFWIQETSTDAVDYSITFTGTAAVPEPVHYATILGLCFLGFVCYRKRKQ